MIPAWKVRRELSRLGQQLRAIPQALTDPMMRARLDRRVAAGLPQVDGVVPAAGRVALFLVWQPDGLAESVLHTCRWLVDSGYAPLVVSNAPLSAADRARLVPLVWRAVERPNFGYDFGGYRDGLTCLHRWGVAPARLVILNDSVWVPLLAGDDLLARMEAAPFDIAGSVLRERGEERFLESYIYSMRGGVVASEPFRAFWAGLRLTSNKYLVIRRGERGFSRAMRAAGFSLGGLFTAQAFLAAAAQADEAALRAVLRHAAHSDDATQSALRALAQAAHPDWADTARTAIAGALSKGQFYSTFPVGAVLWFNYPFLKKSGEPVSARWRTAYVEAIRHEMLVRPVPVVFDEIEAR